MEICLQKSSSNTAYLATQKGPIYFLKECLFVPPIFSTLLDSKSKVFRNEKEPANIQVLINKFGENIRYAETLCEIKKFPMSTKDDWISPKVNIQDSLIGGKGIFANANIKRGEKIIVWGGEYSDATEAENARNKGKLVMQWDDDLYSVEDQGINNGYFVNHSCDPNMWMIDAFTLATKRDIESGEELTADYAMWEANEDYISKWDCECSSPLCRHKVTGKDWRNPTLQERYKEHFSPLLNKRIQRFKNGD